MKKSLITTSVAILLASTSAATFASPVGPLTSFTAGTTAKADEVNGNFTTIETSVNDNNDRIDALETSSGTVNCPTGEMVAVGSICVDIYEASIWDAATGGSQLPVLADPVGGASAYPCTRDGDDCGKPAATAIYARSVTEVTPANWVTWYQATQACANVGKRLPTVAEWQMAALGTPAATGDPAVDCNINNQPVVTGAFANCQTPAGVRDMVGNVMELAADLDFAAQTSQPTPPNNDENLDFAGVPRLGNAFDDNAGGLTTKANVMASSPRGYGSQTGFRCVK